MSSPWLFNHDDDAKARYTHIFRLALTGKCAVAFATAASKPGRSLILLLFGKGKDVARLAGRHRRTSFWLLVSVVEEREANSVGVHNCTERDFSQKRL